MEAHAKRAVDLIYRTKYKWIIAECRAVTKNQEDAEDVAAEIFLVLCRMRGPTVKLLQTITKHRIMDWKKVKGRRLNVFDESPWAKGQYEEIAYGIEMDGQAVPSSGGQSGERDPARTISQEAA